MTTQFGQHIHVVPVMAITQTSDTEEKYSEKIDMVDVQALEFLVTLGTLASSGDSGVWALSVVSSSTVTAAGSLVDFYYRKSAAVGSDDMGDVTLTTVALDLTSTESDLVYQIIVVPGTIAESGTDRRYVGLLVDGASDDNAAGFYSAIALIQPKHAQDGMRSSTA